MIIPKYIPGELLCVSSWKGPFIAYFVGYTPHTILLTLARYDNGEMDTCRADEAVLHPHTRLDRRFRGYHRSAS